MYNNKWKYRIITALFLLPLFFINVKDTHDWGDDFAQYLIQAKNIVEGLPQTENGLLQNVQDPAFAVLAYPVGLPLIISPVYYFWKLNILPYCILISLILFLTGLILFDFFKKRSDVITAILITILFCYNASIIDLKKQILSEIPFTCVLMLALLRQDSDEIRKNKSWLLTGIIFSFLISVRLAGITFVAAYIIFELNKFRKNNYKNERKNIFNNLILCLITTVGLFLLLNGVLFPIMPGGIFGFYSNAFHTHELQFINNINFYYMVVQYIFPFYGSWIPSFWILTALTGWVIRFIKSASLAEYFFPLYLLLILFYPNTNAGLRFLIPIIPLLIYYSIFFINWMFSRAGEKAKWISTAIFIIVLSAYARPLYGVISGQSSVEEGPQQKEAIELFNYLKSTPSNAAMVFCKARAISLYSGHLSLYPAKNESNEETFNQFHRYKELYVVISKAPPDNEIYDQKLLDFISIYHEQYEHVWENAVFNVYRQRGNN